MRAIIFLSSFDLMDYFSIYSPDQSPINLVNLVKRNRYEICREINKNRKEYITLQKTRRFGCFVV
jgi:hypothetical protein